MEFKLRDYQEMAVAKVYEYLQAQDGNPCVVLPTGSGKSPCLAQVCYDAVHRWKGRVCVISHVKELLQQNAETIIKWFPDLALEVGVYSAGLRSRDTQHPIIVGGIQSIYKRICDLGAFDLILVDECHLIPEDGEGMYRTFLAEAKILNPKVRLIGFTATPFRMKTGLLCKPDALLNDVCYAVDVRKLIDDGWLCPLRSKNTKDQLDFRNVHTQGGEFVMSSAADLMDKEEIIKRAVDEILSLTVGRKKILVFCTTIQHAENVKKIIAEKSGEEVGLVHSEVTDLERGAAINDFKSGTLRWMTNVNVLTTGFDARNIDCIVLLRPTMSPGLYQQMVGRGLRTLEGKTDCLVLDYGQNIMRHGPIDAINPPHENKGNGQPPAKECPACHEIVEIWKIVCPCCGFLFPPPKPPERQMHQSTAADDSILSKAEEKEYEVHDISYSIHEKKGASPGAPRTLRVDYRIGITWTKSEWVCVEHDGYPREKALKWWVRRSNVRCPKSAEEACRLAQAGALAIATGIRVREQDGKFDRIIAYQLGDVPKYRGTGWGEDEQPTYREVTDYEALFDGEEIPF